MTSLFRRAILAFALIAGFSPAFAQAPGPVPALPDTERRIAYSLSSSTCACSIPFALYGEGTDYANWIEVWVNGVNVPQFGNWVVTSPSGSLGTLPRPVTDAVLTFQSAQTGTVQIVGARRPRRISQFAENRGVAARDLNQVLTDIIAQNRETWDKTNDITGRGIFAPPGETLNILAAAATRANSVLGFDALGNLGYYNQASAVTAASNVNFLQGGTGAVSRTVQAELRDALKVQQFGAACDGITDDAPAIQRAITFADSLGGWPIAMCPGTSRLNSTPFLNKWTTPGILSVPGLTLRGYGKGVSTLDTAVANGYAIAVNPEWKSAFQALSGGATVTTGGSLGASAPIGTLGAITAGSLYTNGTYTGVALTGGAGSGATANITVSGAAVTAVTLVNAGTGYAVGNTLSAAAASIGGTGSGFSIPVATATYNVQITMNEPAGNEIFVTLAKAFSVTTTTSRVALTLPATNTGYTYNVYAGTGAPANYATVSGGNAIALGGGQTVNVDAIGTAHAIPTSRIATNQQVNISDLSVTSTTAAANASGILLFKAGYSNITNVNMKNLLGSGLVIPDYVGDADGSFVVTVDKSKFDTIAGWCVDASGLALELSNLTVTNSLFNICGTLPANYVLPQNYASSGFTVSSITIGATPVVTTSVPHTLVVADQVYIRAAVFSTGTLADGWYRVCGAVAASTYQLCDLNGNFINTTGFGVYTANSARSMLAWRPPTTTTGSGALRWMGLIGTFKSLGFTQNNNVSMYFTEGGASDNATIEGVDFENTVGKGLYAASLSGGTFVNSECLTAASNGSTIACVQEGTGFAGGGVQNFTIKGMKVRSDVTPMTAFEQFQNTNNGATFADSNRVSGITWQAFDAAGQTRSNGFNFDPIPGQVQFTVAATNTFKLAPIGYGATLPLHLKATGEWVPFRVPDTGVAFAVTTSAINTTYNVYAFNGAATTAPYAISFTVDTVTPVFNHGYYTQSSDASHLFVGQARTDGSGNFQPGNFQVSQYPIQVTSPLVLSGGAIACPACGVISGTGHGDSNYAILPTDSYVYTNAAFTALRTWTLPAANSVIAGTPIRVEDAQNTITTSNALVVSRAGADTINTTGTSVAFTGAGAGATFISDGVSNWGTPVQNVSTGGTGRASLTNHSLQVGALTNPVTQLAVGTNGQFLAGATGADPAFVTMSQDCTVTAAGVMTCTKTNNVSFGNYATLSAGQLTASLGADVNLNVVGTYFDGPSVAQGTTGTWFASGTVTVTATANDNIFCKLYDGTTVIASAEVTPVTTAPQPISLSGALTSPAGNIRIACRDITNTTGKMVFNATSNSKDSTVTAFRIN